MALPLKDPTTSYSTLLALALLCGLGGGNFSSSMANISFFFPKARKGYATGMNAGIGNLGVSVVQFGWHPLVISLPCLVRRSPVMAICITTRNQCRSIVWLSNGGFIWVPFIILSTLAAWFGMNDIASAKASFFSDQAIIFKRKHNWLMCWLYIGYFRFLHWLLCCFRDVERPSSLK